MSYQQQIQGGQGSIRNSTDSMMDFWTEIAIVEIPFPHGSFRPSVEGRDSCTTFGTQVIIDKIYVKVNEMEKNNLKIKQQLMGLSKISKDTKADLEKHQAELAAKQAKRKGISSKQKQSRLQKSERREERHRAMRQGISDMFTEQMKTGVQITNYIKTIPEENDKIKFENILQKKYNNIEMLGKILIQQEKEFLVISKQQLKQFKKMGIDKSASGKKDGQYELESLLNESSSNDDSQDSEESEEDEENEDWDESDLIINLDGNTADTDDLESGQGQHPQMQMLQQAIQDGDVDSQKLAAFEVHMRQRTHQIGNVTESIGKIQDMFKNLNEIVSQQGQVLNRLEDNIIDTKDNTKDTVIELQETIKNEAPTIQERITTPGNDLSTTCVMLWFFFALVMFCIDFGSGKQLPS